jgi:ribonucleotide monophosphatase NagD (HAD superfamily)
MHDSFDWGLDTQLAVDVLTSKDGIITDPINATTNNTQTNHIPVYFSNPDFLWGNEYSRPRFGQGAFQVTFFIYFLPVPL